MLNIRLIAMGVMSKYTLFKNNKQKVLWKNNKMWNYMNEETSRNI